MHRFSDRVSGLEVSKKTLLERELLELFQSLHRLKYAASPVEPDIPVKVLIEYKEYALYFNYNYDNDILFCFLYPR